MTKSIIGYYSEPLSQVERDEILDIISPIIARENTIGFNAELSNLIDETVRENEFVSLSHAQAAVVMTTRVQERIKERILPRGGITSEHLSSIRINIDVTNGALFVAMSDELGEFYKLNKFIRPSPSDIEINSRTIDVCNAWLHDNPDSRVFEKSQLALQVDSVNCDILRKLTRHGYQTETNAPIYDFSKEILSFFNTVRKD